MVDGVKDCRITINNIIESGNNATDEDIRIHMAALDKYRCKIGVNEADYHLVEEGFPKRTQEDIDGIADAIIRFWKDYYLNDEGKLVLTNDSN